jgi:hypothetical protein
LLFLLVELIHPYSLDRPTLEELTIIFLDILDALDQVPSAKLLILSSLFKLLFVIGDLVDIDNYLACVASELDVVLMDLIFPQLRGMACGPTERI